MRITYLLLLFALLGCSHGTRHTSSAEFIVTCGHWDSDDSHRDNTYVEKVLRFRADPSGTIAELGSVDVNSLDGNFVMTRQLRMGAASRHGNELSFAAGATGARFLVSFGTPVGKIRRYYDEYYSTKIDDHTGVGRFDDKPEEPWACHDY